jgi:hypothetical protein
MSKINKGNTDKKTPAKDFAPVQSMPFSKMNYLMIIGGILMVIIGFLLMMGGGSEDPTVFQPEELFSFRRITLAPAVVIAGYIVVIYAIIYRPKNQ